MERFLDPTLLFESPQQLLVIAAVAVLWLALAALGAAAGGTRRPAEVDAVAGWGLAVVLFTLGGVFTELSFTVLAVAAGTAAVAAAAWRWRREGGIATGGELRIAVLALPLILLTSAMGASQWDEFTNWLPNARFLLLTDGFPDAGRPHTGGAFSAYPYALPLVTYLTSRPLGGALLEPAAPLFNVLLHLAFGLLVVRVVRHGLADAGGTAVATGTPSWVLCALGALAAVPFNPTFVQKIVLTNYADSASAVSMGVAGVIGWLALNALAGGERAAARRLALLAGLALTVLVALKQANLILFLLVVVTLAVAGLRDRAIGWRRFLPLVPVLTAAPLIVYAAWRYHVATELTAGEFSFRPVAGWHWPLIADILLKMAEVLFRKGGYLGIMAVASVFALLALRRCTTPFDRLAIVAGGAFVGYNGFLFFTYFAAFGEYDALRAASLWRYNIHLGPLAIAFAWYGLAFLWVRHRVAGRLGRGVRHLGTAAIVLVLIAPLAFAPKLRFDREPEKPYFRAVAADIGEHVGGGERFTMLDPKGSGEAWGITLYALYGQVEPAGYRAAYDRLDADSLRNVIEGRDSQVVLVHSLIPAVNEVLGTDLSGSGSFLLRRSADGSWRVVETWQRPAE